MLSPDVCIWGSPNTLVEALISGCIVCANTGVAGVNEIIDSGKFGCEVDMCDVDVASKRIDRYLANTTPRDYVGLTDHLKIFDGNTIVKELGKVERNENTTPIFIPGAGRAGTTFLMDTIGSHPQVSACRHKEPCYFDRNHNLGYGFYEGLFNIKEGHIYTVEASTNYLWYPDALELIQAFNPSARLLFRCVIGERAFAEYKRRIEKNGEERTFFDVFTNTGFGKKRSNYVPHLKRLYSLFPENQILCLIFEEKKNPGKLSGAFGDFLALILVTLLFLRQQKINQVCNFSSASKVSYGNFYSDPSENSALSPRAAGRGVRCLNHMYAERRPFPDVKV